MDNGSAFSPKKFTRWAVGHNIIVDYIYSGCPYQNGYIKRFNGTVRTAILEGYIFNRLNEVKAITQEWMGIDNNEKLPNPRNDITRIEYRNAAS